MSDNGYNLGDFSDGYHTFNELYEHRNMLFLMFLRWYGKENNKKVFKSIKHQDGSQLDGWFLVGCEINGKQISYHLPLTMWKYCNFLPSFETSPVVWDGHTSDDVLATFREILLTDINKL